MAIDLIYTLAMGALTEWLVHSSEALYDLDKIQLGKLFPTDNALEAKFQLDYIVIGGHARASITQTAPRRL